MKKFVILALTLIVAALYVNRSQDSALKAAGLAGNQATAKTQVKENNDKRIYVLTVAINPELASIESIEPRPVSTKNLIQKNSASQ